jgi:hypothetical protein
MATPSRWIAAVTAATFLITSIPLPPFSAVAYAKDSTPPPVAAIVGLRTQDTSVESQARTYLAKELEGSKKLRLAPEPLTDKAVDEVWAEEKSDAAGVIDKAHKDFFEGKRLYERLALEEAIAALGSSVRGYREGIVALRENRFLLLSHLYLGMALIIIGRETEGRKYIREMIVLDPTRKEQKLSQREFSPKIIGIHRSLTEEILRGPSGRLQIETKPAGAMVVMDGVVQKSGQEEVKDVPVGEHFMVVEMKGYRQFSRRILIGPGLNKININLEEWKPLAPYSANRRRDLVYLDILSHLSAQLGAQILVLANMTTMSNSEATLTAQLFDGRSKEFSKIERVDVPMGKIKKGSETLAKQLLGNLATGGLVLAEVTAPVVSLENEKVPYVETPTRAHKKTKSVFERWWFWTAVGVVLAGGAGAAFLLARKNPNFNVLNVQNPIPAQ